MSKLTIAGATLALVAFGCSSNSSTSSGTADGTDGTNASTAADATDGTAATDGTSGTDGTSSADGTSAADGTSGTDGTSATDGTTGTTGGPVIDLRVDTNRDGVVSFDDPTDDAGEDTWGPDAGAVFLANIDDDQTACITEGKTDSELPLCHDAADEVINGASDVMDLAPMYIAAWPGAPEGTEAHLSMNAEAVGNVRIFHRVAKGNPLGFVAVTDADTFTTADLQEGIELAVEGIDIVRDAAVWDGFVDITLTVTDANGAELGTDAVRMRVAPLLTYHHLLPAETVYAANFNFGSSIEFRAGLTAALNATGTPNPLFGINYSDQWAQDYFETGFMTMPSVDGQHTIRVNIRSANVNSPNPANPVLRTAGRFVFDLRGPDTAAVQQFDVAHSQANGQMDSLNSFGNFETTPPYSLDGVNYPMGRIFRGSIPSFTVDPSFKTMFESQAAQAPIYVDTSWLLVGHVDETITFVPMDNERGWTIAANDAAQAKALFEKAVTDGFGDVPMFVGKQWSDDTNAETTISQLLANTNVLNESAKAVEDVQAQLDILQAATGITDEEIIWIPFMHESINGFSVAYQPGTVNGIWLDKTNFAVPDPHGPVIDGKDLFKTQLDTEFAKYGITVHYVEDWDLYHALLGEVHCGSNATRAIPEALWWEAK